MRFLVDECTGPKVAAWLRSQGYEVLSVFDEDRGNENDVLIQKAHDETWILITNDKDFGEKVFRERRPHRGVIFMSVLQIKLTFFVGCLKVTQTELRISSL